MASILPGTTGRGYDPGDASMGNRSHILTDYQTGGTPWHILIDKQGIVRFNDFHVDPSRAMALIRTFIEH